MAGRAPKTGEQVITAHLRRRRDLAPPEIRDAAYAHAEELGLSSRRRRPLSQDQAAALQGATTLEQARAVLRDARRSAEQPTGGESATQRVAGVDLTFSAPKSVSLLWGLTRDPELRRGLEQAHTLASRRALRELESRALVGRARVGGKRVRVPLEWLGIEAVHTTARLSEQGAREGRPPDPDLHTHTVIANMAWDPGRGGAGEGGKWRAVDAGVLLHVRSLGDGVYLTELAAQLRSLGLEVVPNTGRDGRYLEVAGIEPVWCQAFSARAHEVRRARELLGIETDVPARALAPATRRGKGEEVHADHTEAWRAHLAERFGSEALEDVDQVADVRQREGIPVERPREEREGELLERFFGPEGLCAHEASHTQVAVEASLWHLNGGRLSTEEMAGEGGEGGLVARVLQDAEGGRLVVLDDGRYTTRELLQQEVAVERYAGYLLSTRQQISFIPPPYREAIDHALSTLQQEGGVRLDPEQRRALELLANPTRRLLLVGGPAGAGKTTTLRAAREVWEGEGGQGREVVVLSVAAQTAQRTAREMGAARGMTFEEFTGRRRRGEFGDGEQLRRLVVVVDEAAMADTPRLHALFRSVGGVEGGASVVLLGDERQLQPVGPGGSWPRIKQRAQDRGAYVELGRVHRQRHEWERQALDQLRGGRGGEAIAAYLVHDRIRITDTRAEARHLVAEAWDRARRAGATEGRPLSDYVMVAATREDTAVLNQWAQGIRRQRGELGPGTTLRDREGRQEVFQGDRVRLEGRLDWDHPNGIRGVVVEVTKEELRIQWDTGQRDSRYRPRDHQRSGEGGQREGGLQLDYAATTQRTQGVTAEQAFVLPGPEQGLEALYSAFSRARGETTVYLDRHSWSERRSELGPRGQAALDQAQLVARLAVRASQSELKRGALDVGAGSPPGPRVEAAQAKLLAYSRAVAQTRRAEQQARSARTTSVPSVAAPPSRESQEAAREREQEYERERHAREAYEHQQAQRERGPSIGY